MKVSFDNKKALRLASLLLAVLFTLVFAAAGCKLGGEEAPAEPTPEPNEDGTIKTEGNPVVISSPHLDFTLYDFRSAYYSGQDYMYVYYGMMSQEDYFNNIVNNCTEFISVYNAAVDAGIELTDEEKAEIETAFDDQLESIISQYEGDVDETVTDPAQRREKAMERLNEDLASDGLDIDTLEQLAKNNMRANTIVDKYFISLQDEISVSSEEVLEYINTQLESSGEMTMETFHSAYEAYSAGQGAFPVYVPDECFSVDHIFIPFETDTDENGGVVYIKESTAAKEAEIEAKLPGLADYEAFMELEVEYGEDPGMDDEGYRENGYLIHGDFDYSYFEGFVYAAMNLKNGAWTPSPNPSTGEVYELPELTYFRLNDGTPVVKVATDPGVHYLIVNKTFQQGPVPYEEGDAHWMSWSDAVKDEKFSNEYETLLEGWKSQFEIVVHTDVFKAEFVPPAAEGETTGEGDDKK